jgi:hypothetical protein
VADWVCGRCKSLNRERAVTCYSCGGARGAIPLQPNTLAQFGQGQAARDPATGRDTTASPSATAGTAGAGLGVGVGTGAASMAGGPAVLAAARPGDGAGVGAAALPAIAVPEATPAPPAGAENLLGGLVGGAIGAVLATALWYGVVAVTEWQVGLVAIAVGFIVGQAVVFGASGRGSVLLVAASLGLTLAALVTSEYLIANHFYNQAMAEFAAETGVSVAEVQAFLPSMSPVELVRLSIESEPITLLFWAIAGYEAFIIPLRALTRGGVAEA